MANFFFHSYICHRRHWRGKCFCVIVSRSFESAWFCAQVMPVENSMAKPQHFLGCPSVLNVTMTIVVALYTVMGVFGYLRYGELVEGSITLNIPTDHMWVDDRTVSYAMDLLYFVRICFFFFNRLGQAVKVLIGVAILFTYGLQFFVPLKIIWDSIKDRFSHKWAGYGETLMRFLMVMLTGKFIIRSILFDFRESVTDAFQNLIHDFFFSFLQ